jgi:F0F1-type ATP synthase delta subunit
MIQLLVLPLLIFVALVFFLRYLVTQNVSKATGHLQQMSKEYAAKESEINKRLHQSKEEAQTIITKAQHEVEELRTRSQQEAYRDRDTILKDARQRCDELVQRAEHTCESLKREVTQKFEDEALKKACELLENTLPKNVRQELHALWMKEAEGAGLKLEHLNLPSGTKEVTVTSAFALTQQQKEGIRTKLKKALGKTVNLKDAVDPKLVAGFTIAIGNVVIDMSLQSKIQAVVKEHIAHEG